MKRNLAQKDTQQDRGGKKKKKGSPPEEVNEDTPMPDHPEDPVIQAKHEDEELDFLREKFIRCLRDPEVSILLSKTVDPTDIVVNRGMIIALEQYVRGQYAHSPIFFCTYSATPFGGIDVTVGEYALYTALNISYWLGFRNMTLSPVYLRSEFWRVEI